MKDDTQQSAPRRSRLAKVRRGLGIAALALLVIAFLWYLFPLGFGIPLLPDDDGLGTAFIGAYFVLLALLLGIVWGVLGLVLRRRRAR